jgi:TonB family protein
MNRSLAPCAALIVALACGRANPGDQGGSRAPAAAEDPPVALNPDVPVAYPPALYDRGVDGEVVLRLFVDSTGRLTPESTRVAESSGYPAMDSAALIGSPRLRYAPAKRHGLSVAAIFLQPIQFHHPTAAPGGPAASAPPTVSVRPTPAPTTAPTPKPRRRAPRPPPDTAAAPPRLDTVPAHSDSAPAPAPTPVPVPHDTTADSSHVKADSSARTH